MQGEHKAGYRRPRAGEKRAVLQPLRIDKLSAKVREVILASRAAGKTWQETALAASAEAGETLHDTTVRRWYDLRVEQVQKEVMEQAERSRAIAAAFAAKGFDKLPEAALNALTSEVFAVMEAGEAASREKALGNLVFVMSKLITAQAKQKAVELEAEKIELAKQKFEQLRSKAEKATNEAAAKLGKGRQLTVADINRIRERALGLPPIAG
jgi:hypothetical protein